MRKLLQYRALHNKSTLLSYVHKSLAFNTKLFNNQAKIKNCHYFGNMLFIYHEIQDLFGGFGG